MNRRSSLVVMANLAGVMASGCTSIVPGSGGTNGLEPKDRPEIPETISNETVARFVEEYEVARQHNALLERDGPDLAETDASFNAAIDVSTADAFYLSGFTSGSTTDENGGVGDLSMDRTYYCVTEEEVYRVPERNIESGDAYGAEEGSIDPVGVRIVNFATERHEVRIDVREQRGTDSEPAFSSTFDIEKRACAGDSSVIGTEGEYAVEVSLDGRQVKTREWLLEGPTWWSGLNIYVTVDGTIEIGVSDQPP